VDAYRALRLRLDKPEPSAAQESKPADS